MAKLRDLVFDELKIDQGFTHGAAGDERKAAIFHASVQIAKRLGMKIVAEGVEDQADWDFCRINGADIAQGYFMSRPLAPDDMEAWLAAWRLRHGAPFPDGVEASS
jgi:EAL domain-containing protein (putative c-di-GMP-specific phosphodiesterase class I)